MEGAEADLPTLVRTVTDLEPFKLTIPENQTKRTRKKEIRKWRCRDFKKMSYFVSKEQWNMLYKDYIEIAFLIE